MQKPNDLRSIRLVEKWLIDNKMIFDITIIPTWISIVDLRNMEPLHSRRDAAALMETLAFFGERLPINYEKLWGAIIDKFGTS